MKYALINGNKTEAMKGLDGLCPNCLAELVAKCGDLKMHHWAHKGIRHCDLWWENETHWHREWKRQYPADWQEISLRDHATNEIHIADVQTNEGLIIEFQHSNINPHERIARERFYKEMVWVIDGTRLKRDYSRFLKGKTDFRPTNDPQIFYVDIHAESFPSAWIGSASPVIFDFKGNEAIAEPEDPRQYLYCLQPNIDSRYAFLSILSRQEFINSTVTGEWTPMIKRFFDRPNLYQYLQQAHTIKNFGIQRASPYIYDRGRFIVRKRF